MCSCRVGPPHVGKRSESGSESRQKKNESMGPGSPRPGAYVSGATAAKEPECRNGQGCLFLHCTGWVYGYGSAHGDKEGRTAYSLKLSLASVFWVRSTFYPPIISLTHVRPPSHFFYRLTRAADQPGGKNTRTDWRKCNIYRYEYVLPF